MVKVKKDNITKEISENLLPDYERLGWKVVKSEDKEKKPLNDILSK